MELHYVNGIAFAKKADPSGHISVYAFQESTPADPQPRVVKIGHYDPTAKKLWLGQSILPALREKPVGTGEYPDNDYLMMPLDKVQEMQAHYTEQRKSRAEFDARDRERELGVDNIRKAPDDGDDAEKANWLKKPK